MSALKIDNLVYRWPQASSDTLWIDELSLAPGQRLFLHGPSGCGKFLGGNMYRVIKQVWVCSRGTLSNNH